MTEKQSPAFILIVDDEPSIIELLDRKLSEDGYSCVSAFDGDTAINKLKSHVFDLVLLDIKMPGTTGLDVLEYINLHSLNCAVIVITGVVDVETAIATLKLGVYDYILKPIQLDVFSDKVAQALEKRQQEIEHEHYQACLEDTVSEQRKSLNNALRNAVESLAYALEVKDKYTSSHSKRVTQLAVAIAREMRMPDAYIEKLRLACLVHDVGKIGVTDPILNKPDQLMPHERLEVMSHSEIGEQILSYIIQDQEILKTIRHHHEQYNGYGYPDGLSGEQIPHAARILRVADTYDAMTSIRPYREAMTVDEACEVIFKEKGNQFDPEIVDAFLNIILTSNTPYSITARQ
jgi:putative nucleotidyltransferase with HDIG domain